MGLSWWIVAGMWCMSGIYCFNTERADDVQDEYLISGLETQKFLDEFEGNRMNVEATKAPGAEGHKRLFLFFVDSDKYTGGSNESTPLDSWSVVWYVASFGGLIIFFLIVSCSEWCCRRAIRNSHNCTRSSSTPNSPNVPDTPPPSYDHFAPPSYESICLGRQERGEEKSKYDIYVVPVHAFGSMMETREDAPPSYFTASRRDFVPALENTRIT